MTGPTPMSDADRQRTLPQRFYTNGNHMSTSFLGDPSVFSNNAGGYTDNDLLVDPFNEGVGGYYVPTMNGYNSQANGMLHQLAQPQPQPQVQSHHPQTPSSSTASGLETTSCSEMDEDVDDDESSINSPPPTNRKTSAAGKDAELAYVSRSKFRRNTKPLNPIDVGKARNPAEKKRMQNTLAARKTRARREARQLAMEAKNVELRCENQLLREYVRTLRLPLPYNLMPQH